MTNHPQYALQHAPQNEPATYDWFTTSMLANGSHTIQLRPRERRQNSEVVYLDEPQSRLLMNALNKIAQDGDIPWSRAR